MSEHEPRELIVLPGEELPQNLSADRLRSFKISEITDQTEQVKDIYYFGPEHIMPVAVAE
jgi:hypothetical protein